MHDCVEAFREQADWCVRLGTPFTAAVVRWLGEALAANDPTMVRLVGDWPGDPRPDALPLRLAGALHCLVLTAADPDLATCYPLAAFDADRLSQVLALALTRHAGWIADFITSPPQTNEAARSAVLLGGFLTVAQESGLPLRLLELGASAGLNLGWDRFHYRLGEAVWGDPESPLHLSPRWDGPLPPLPPHVEIVARAGCDRNPIVPFDPEQALRLRSFIWAEQSDRMAVLDRAIAVAKSLNTRVEPADAADWLASRLAEPAPGRATVVYHSIVWQYLPEATRARIAALMSRHGDAATANDPLAWLRLEPEAGRFWLDLTLWPGGTTRRLAEGHPHGASVRWLGT